MTGSPLVPKLVAFKVTHLGDTLLFLPVLQTLLARRPDLKALVFTTPLAAPLFAGCGVDGLIEVPWREFRRAPWRHPLQWLRWRSTVRRYAGGLALIGPEQGSTAHLLARAARPGACVAWARTPARMRARITHPVELPDNESVARWEWRLGRAAADALAIDWPDFPPTPDLTALIRSGRPSAGGEVVVHPGASREYQRWPRAHFAAVAQALAETVPVVWIETEEHAEPLRHPRITAVHRPSLADLAATIGGARLLLGNNSGPMHFASALGTPAVIVTGPSSPVWNPAWHADRITLLRAAHVSCAPCDAPHCPAEVCHRRDAPLACLTAWDVPTVLAACQTRLNAP